MAATSAALQAHHDEIRAVTPSLPLWSAPTVLSSALGAGGVAAADARLAKAVARAAAGASRCQCCGAACGSGSGRQQQLGLLVSTRLDFSARTVTATAAQVACSLCRAVSSPALLLELAAPTLGSEDCERSEQLQQLFLHLAAVNGAPPAVTGNPDALAVWVQELACRAYGLHVVANSLRGWRLLGPKGQHVDAAAAPRLLQQLLRGGGGGGEAPAGKQQQQQQQQQTPRKQPRPAKGGSATPAAATAPAPSGSKRKSPAGSEAAAAGAAAAGPASAKKQKKAAEQHLGAAAAAAAAGSAGNGAPSPAAAATPPAKALRQAEWPGGTAGKAAKGKLSQTPGGERRAPKEQAKAPKHVSAAVAPFKTPQAARAPDRHKGGKRRLSAA